MLDQLLDHLIGAAEQRRAKYDDGGFSGGNTDRPALQRLLADVRAGKVDVIVVYKVDRLTRSLADFAKLVELFDAHNVILITLLESILSVMQISDSARQIIYGAMIIAMMLVYGRDRRVEG
jgi:DNA invertase Pin-like site-specific DNA recombinase